MRRLWKWIRKPRGFYARHQSRLTRIEALRAETDEVLARASLDVAKGSLEKAQDENRRLRGVVRNADSTVERLREKIAELEEHIGHHLASAGQRAAMAVIFEGGPREKTPDVDTTNEGDAEARKG